MKIILELPFDQSSVYFLSLIFLHLTSITKIRFLTFHNYQLLHNIIAIFYKIEYFIYYSIYSEC